MKIKELRLKKGMTQSEVALNTGYTQQAVAKWESGESEPNLKTLMKLSEMFGCTLDQLMKG